MIPMESKQYEREANPPSGDPLAIAKLIDHIAQLSISESRYRMSAIGQLR
jgi:hypothetical protein